MGFAAHGCSRHRNFGNFPFETEITHKFSEEISTFFFKLNGEGIFLFSTVPQPPQGLTPLAVHWLREAIASV